MIYRITYAKDGNGRNKKVARPVKDRAELMSLRDSPENLELLAKARQGDEKAKRNLDHGVNNESLIGLSRLQDSLTYFTTSIRGNATLLQKLKFKLQVDELDADLIEDVNIEMTQAREITSIYSNILESTMDTYSSIINNNVNTVMRTLTAVTIILTVPMLVASFFGMNLINGMENNAWGFAVALIISAVIAGCSWAVLRHKRLV